MSQGLKIIYGAASASFNDARNRDDAETILAALKKSGVDTLDTAQLYGESESVLGSLNAGQSFIIDTKVKGGFDAGESLKPDSVYKTVHESIAKLKVKQVDILYIHAPDDKFPPATWLPTIDKLHKEGLFKRFGLSNFTPAQVQEVHDVASKGGHVLPTAFQGNYSPIARVQESELFPLLRSLKIAFYAYSPLAGGFLTKTKEALLAGQDVGRFSQSAGQLGDMYRTLYFKPTYLDALETWAGAADLQGCSKAELAYRWVSYHSPLKASQGDGVIFGGRNVEQVSQTVEGLRQGPLKPEVVQKIDEVWETIKHEAPLDNYNSFIRQG